MLSTSLDKLVKTLADTSHKTLKDLKEEIVDNDEILHIMNEDKNKNDSNKDFKKDYSEEINLLEEALLKYIGEKDPKF